MKQECTNQKIPVVDLCLANGSIFSFARTHMHQRVDTILHASVELGVHRGLEKVSNWQRWYLA